MNNDSAAALLATAEAKAVAHDGLTDALEYGRIRAVRRDGVDYVYARGALRTFEIRFDSYGRAHCRGYVLSSTNRDLASDALAAALDGIHYLNR